MHTDNLLILLDASNIVMRHYFGSGLMPKETLVRASKEITKIGLIYGLDEANSENMKIIIALDGVHSKHERQKLMPDYKAHRPTDTLPTEFIDELHDLRAMSEIDGIKIDCREGVEADDLIAAYCKTYPTHKKIIVSTDKDMYGLIDKNTSVFRGSALAPLASNLDTLVDEDVLCQMYSQFDVITKHGINLYPIYKSLVGDPSDGIKGVKGVGKQTAPTYMRKISSTVATLSEAHEQMCEYLSKYPKYSNSAYDYMLAYSLIIPRTDGIAM